MPSYQADDRGVVAAFWLAPAPSRNCVTTFVTLPEIVLHPPAGEISVPGPRPLSDLVGFINKELAGCITL